MKTGIPYRNIWVLVDKRGVILEHSTLRTLEELLVPLSYKPVVPQFSFWANRSSARWQANEIKSSMTKECWDTWKFRVVKYSRS